MNTTYVLGFEDKATALQKAGLMKTSGYKVYLIEDSDQIQLWKYPKQGSKETLLVGEIDDQKSYLVLATKDPVVGP